MREKQIFEGEDENKPCCENGKKTNLFVKMAPKGNWRKKKGKERNKEEQP